jgi:hypothetical protein
MDRSKALLARAKRTLPRQGRKIEIWLGTSLPAFIVSFFEIPPRVIAPQLEYEGDLSLALFTGAGETAVFFHS